MSPFLRGSAVILTVLVALFVASVSVDLLHPFSFFFGALVKAALAVIIFAAIDKYVLDEIDTVAEIKQGNIAYALLLLALALLIAANVATAQPLPGDYSPKGTLTDASGARFAPSGVAHLDSVLTQVGTVERGRNDGPAVRRYLRVTGLGPGYAWCAALTSWGFEVAGAPGPTDRAGRVIRTAGARRFNEAVGTIPARLVLRGTHRPPPGSVVTWQRGSGWQGHSGLVVRDDNARVRGRPWYLRCGLTVEGNTSSGRAGSQRDGDGVYRRERCIEPGSYFRITDFTLV